MSFVWSSKKEKLSMKNTKESLIISVSNILEMLMNWKKSKPLKLIEKKFLLFTKSFNPLKKFKIICQKSNRPKMRFTITLLKIKASIILNLCQAQFRVSLSHNFQLLQDSIKFQTPIILMPICLLICTEWFLLHTTRVILQLNIWICWKKCSIFVWMR